MQFPLPFVPAESWHVSPRRYGANRAGGRKHAGCDLYAPVGTPVRAVADGTVKAFSFFYKGTYALVVDHGDFWIRYGEIDKTLPAGLQVGSKVKEGDEIGTVGDLEDLDLSMVHFEMYSGTSSGPLTVPGNKPFMRRADLIDPTSFLDGLANLDTQKILRIGSKGDAVADWQRRLLAQGYAMSIDGDFGQTTEAATKEFQRDSGLTPDGIVGRDTYVAMVEAEKD